MPFVSRENNNGQVDPNVNRRGRPLKGQEKKITRREAKDKEMLTLARKLKPGAQIALREALKILNNEAATENAKLKAAQIYLKYFTLVVDKLYEASGKDELPESESNVEDVQPQQPVQFSLHVLKKEE